MRYALALLSLLLCQAAAAQGPYFALQPAAHERVSDPLKAEPPRGNRLVSVKQLRLPGVDGFTIRIRRHWQISFLAECVARAHEAGDPYSILLCSGDNRQPWLDVNVRDYEARAAQLGRLYAGDPLCDMVHVTGCSPYGTSEELHWSRPISPTIEAANKRLITAWAKAFPRQRILLAISGKDPDCMRRLIKHGLSAAPGRLLVKNNALKASTSPTAPHNKLVNEAGRLGALIGFETVGSTREARFGGTFPQAMAKARTIAAGTPISYVAVYPADLDKLKGN